VKYLSLFSGIGGFELGIKQAYERISNEVEQRGCGQEKGELEAALPMPIGESDKRQYPTCIGYSEIDRYASSIYQYHFPEHKNYGDITKLDPTTLPDFDLLVGGFPCQTFSIAGKRKGFDDTRGTLFFEIARVLRAKQPRLLLLENVKGLLSHDHGQTFATIIATLDELGYDLQWQVINSKNHGVPQNRERVFIVGNRKGTRQPRVFPIELPYDYSNTTIEKVYLLSTELSQKYGQLLPQLPQSKEGLLLREQMQTMLSEVGEGVQKGECREVQSEAESLDTDAKGSLQVVEELNSWTSNQDKSGEVCGVVQIPTEEVLLLWSSGGDASISFRQVQQQDLSFECGQNRLTEILRGKQSSSLLFAVQSYQGRLFYSIGNGRDWQKLYIKTLDKWNTTLSSILEEQVDPKYFLSQQMVERLMSYRDTSVTPLQDDTKEHKRSERTLVRVNSMHKKLSS
jgi:DNA (cytosine-5)-methyltransferase 1